MSENPIILYSTGCAKCGILKKKLDTAGIAYEENHNEDEMAALGMMSAPGLMVNGELLDFSKAVQWVNTYHGV